MTVPWNDIRAEFDRKHGLADADRAHAARATRAYGAGYRLSMLREHAAVAPAVLAERMTVGQAEVTAIERGDLDFLNHATTRAYVEALGGTLRTVARFEDLDIVLDIPASEAGP